MEPEQNPARSTDEQRGGETLSTFGPGSNVLIRGPLLSGKRTLALALLAALPKNERAVVLSAATDAESVRRRLVTAGNDDVSVDCYVVDAMQSQVSGKTLAQTDGGDRRTWYNSSPNDLTGLGISTMQALSAINNEGARPRVAVDSLSTLLQYNSLGRIYRFLHVLNGRVNSLNGVTIQVIHSDAHTEREVATLAHLFDTVLDVTSGPNDGAVMVRTGRSNRSFSLSDLLTDVTSARPTDAQTA